MNDIFSVSGLIVCGLFFLIKKFQDARASALH